MGWGCGLCVSISAFLLSLLFLSLYFALPRVVTDVIDKSVIVDRFTFIRIFLIIHSFLFEFDTYSPNSSGYARWSNSCSPGLPPIYYSYYLYEGEKGGREREREREREMRVWDRSGSLSHHFCFSFNLTNYDDVISQVYIHTNHSLPSPFLPYSSDWYLYLESNPDFR